MNTTLVFVLQLTQYIC